ncbi:hypothetical protein evm_000055 [Chilo suppressalis]|nr:hypothetical protein evm_000055 [Chilo suppressalis]
MQLRCLRRSDRCAASRADVSASTETQELEKQKIVVRSLQTNLAIIEDLYRECFYETAKQEELIESLRHAYLNARDTTHIHLDIATETDSLKLDASNCLNSSNNDSGVWERGGARMQGEGEGQGLGEAGVDDDLRHITDQLLRLREMLTVRHYYDNGVLHNTTNTHTKQ